MSFIYTCKHCGHVIGKLDQQAVDPSALGWDTLSTEDKLNMIHYHSNGDVHIRIICEDCEETLVRYPEYHELDFFIQ